MRSSLRRIGRSALVGTLALASTTVIAHAATARASGPIEVPPYGEVARYGGFDEKANYKGPGTTELTEPTGRREAGEARFVYPIGMALDTADPTVPAKDGYAIYVLDLLNPQVLANFPFEPGPTPFDLKLEYRLQKLGSSGEILASQKLTLASSMTTPALHAAALAVDGADDRVYVLLADRPPTEGNRRGEEGAVAAYAIEAFTAGRAAGEQALAPAGQLAGPATLQPGGATLIGDIQPDSLVVAGGSGERTLALAGDEYEGAEGYPRPPSVERVAIGGEHPGSLVGAPWRGQQDLEAAEDEAERYWWGTGLQGTAFAVSANPDGSLSLTFGPSGPAEARSADGEPIMATLAPDLTSTSPILPWASAGPAGGGTANLDRAATLSFHQELGTNGNSLAAAGATQSAGTLAPSVVALAGEAQKFPEGVYAGLVAQSRAEGGGIDRQSGKPYSWLEAGAHQKSESPREVLSVTPASLGIRLFDAQGESLGMIGNIAATGACNLQGGPYGEVENQSNGSFAALAAGRDGTLFALVQPDLDGKRSPFPPDPAAPLAKTIEKQPLQSVQGDQIVELAPGAGQNGAPGQECPQPSGDFSITNVTLPGSTTSTGDGPVTVTAGETLKLDAGAIDLQGGTPYAYDWESGDGATRNDAWVAENEWKWPPSAVEFKYATPGTYTAKLRLVNDFGTLSAQRTVEVVPPEPITGTKVAVVGSPVAGQLVSLEGSAVFPKHDWAVDYHWEFGDGEGEDQPGGQGSQAHNNNQSPQNNRAQHIYAAAGTYPVTLKVIDRLGQVAQALPTTVTVAPPPPEPPPASPPPSKPALSGSLGASSITPPAPGPTATSVPHKAVASRAQRLAEALKSCRHEPRRRRAICVRQARKRYALHRPSKRRSRK